MKYDIIAAIIEATAFWKTSVWTLECVNLNLTVPIHFSVLILCIYI